MKWLVFLCVGVFLGIGLPFVMAGETPTHVPDRSTQNALDELDVISVPAHAPDRETRTRLSGWLDLLRFFVPGLVVGASIGISASIAGTFVLLRREALVALAIPQAVAVGAAAAMRLGCPTLPPSLAAVLAALIYFNAGLRGAAAARAGKAMVVPAFYVSALSLSFLIIAHGGQHLEELQNLFTGIDVAVTPLRAQTVAPLLLGAGLTCGLLWRRWLLIAQAPAAAELAGVNVTRWNTLFLSLASMILLLATDSQGVVMTLAMLFLPPAIVAPWVKRIPSSLYAAACVSLFCLAAAFVMSVEQSWPLSQSVGGVGFVLLICSQFVNYLHRLRRRGLTSRVT